MYKYLLLESGWHHGVEGDNEILLLGSKHWVTVQHVIELGDGVPAREKHLKSENIIVYKLPKLMRD
jgi:hypothetical protein